MIKGLPEFIVAILFASIVYAADALPPFGPTTAIPIAAETDNDTIVTIKVTPEGYLLTSNADGTSEGPTATPPSTYTDFGSLNVDTVKASSGVVFSLTASNSNGVDDRYILVHNKATDPVLSDVPVAAFIIPSEGQTIIGTDFFTNNGLLFSSGIAFCYSSTEETCTPALASEFAIVLNYE